eukprot:scaffold4007_cov49-Cyclotella_meneghiniana.AAC.9
MAREISLSERNHTTIHVAEWMLRNTTATQPHSNQSGVRGMLLFEWLAIKWSRSQEFLIDIDFLFQFYKSKWYNGLLSLQQGMELRPQGCSNLFSVIHLSFVSVGLIFTEKSKAEVTSKSNES